MKPASLARRAAPRLRVQHDKLMVASHGAAKTATLTMPRHEPLIVYDLLAVRVPLARRPPPRRHRAARATRATTAALLLLLLLL